MDKSAQELVEKTRLVDGFLLPLLTWSDVPKAALREFRVRWYAATLLQRDPTELARRAARYGILCNDAHAWVTRVQLAEILLRRAGHL